MMIIDAISNDFERSWSSDMQNILVHKQGCRTAGAVYAQ